MPGDYLQKLKLPLTEVSSIITLVYWDLNPLENKPASQHKNDQDNVAKHVWRKDR